MKEQKIIFNNFIICNSLVELKGEFNYDQTQKLFFQEPKIDFGNQPDWLKYERIELRFDKNFNNGIYREYYKSKKLRREVLFVSIENSENFYADGIERVYYAGPDSNGNQTYTILHENGYKKGERVGVWKLYSTDGGLMSEDYFDDMIYLDNGFYCIKQIDYYPSSNRIESINDKDYGKSFYESGSLKAEWKNKNYFKYGNFTEYHKNKKLKMKVNYINGQRNGLMLKYYEDGTPQEEWDYSHGVRNYIKKYYKNGGLKSEWKYNKGVLILKNEYYNNGKIKTKN